MRIRARGFNYLVNKPLLEAVTTSSLLTLNSAICLLTFKAINSSHKRSSNNLQTDKAMMNLL